jgi:hypothetical protein
MGTVAAPADLPAVRVRRQLLIGGAADGSALALMAAVGAYGAARDEPFSVFAKEPIEQFGADTYVGLLAHVTWFLWVIAATTASFSALLLRRQGAGARATGFLVALAFLSTVLLADDFMMLRERVLPDLGSRDRSLRGLRNHAGDDPGGVEGRGRPGRGRHRGARRGLLGSIAGLRPSPGQRRARRLPPRARGWLEAAGHRPVDGVRRHGLAAAGDGTGRRSDRAVWSLRYRFR